MPRRLAIIPARGGSKRIPDKNSRDFCGKPIIAYSLDAAEKSNLFDVIHVSTESSRIIEVVENLGFSVQFKRPEALADDHSPIMPVLKYVAETYRSRGQTFDQVCLIMGCAPLIEASDLIEAAELFERFEGRRSVLAVAPYSAPIEWAFERFEDGALTPVNPGAFATRSQDLGVKYYDAGLFAFFPADRVIESKDAGDDSDFLGYVLERGKAIDIDDPSDLDLAEVIYLGRNKQRILSRTLGGQEKVEF